MTTDRLFMKALLDPEQALPTSLNPNPGNQARFAVYRNNVRASLSQALADTFPVCQQLVGDDFFRAMSGLYIEHSPPSSPLLAKYGEHFPDFIASFAPAAVLPYLADLARMELDWLNVLHAAEPIQLDVDALGSILTDPHRVARLRLVLQPCARLIRSPYAVVSLWQTHQGQLDIATVDPLRPEQALLVRPEHQVLLLTLNEASAHFIARLSLQPLTQALEHTLLQYPDFTPESTLTLLLQQRAIGTFYLTGDES
ncbi:DUF2063 domain-containing protein [Oceanisphaera marina]|uniref:DUF2063 domain-containing protein n=1 Tax=Oceanisphaera marina TaxID=2017550 RepID=A0ABQ1IJ71_9GAMM|nr:putative DNA-binding domain-containing protein [Oceanisphaera marina]GGB44181.1 DUF2063 domain-containing protein [Oceanisphaera marina]